LINQTAVGWILDVINDYDNNDIILLIKLVDGKVISFKQTLREFIFYILPTSYPAGEDLFQQLSRHDQLIKRIFWDEKYIDLLDKNKTRLIGLSLSTTSEVRQEYKALIQKLNHDPRVNALYNIDLSQLMQFIYNQLKIPPTSKVKIEYDDDDVKHLLSIKRIDDSNEIAPPPFSAMYIEISSESIATADDDNHEPLKLAVKTDGQDAAAKFVIDSLSDLNFISYIKEQNPDIFIICGNDNSLYSMNDTNFKECFKHKVVIHSHSSVDDIELLDLVEKARFSYLPLRFASKYGIMRLIDGRITYELVQRDFVIPTRMQTISKHHEQIRTLEDIVEGDKAGMIISPEIGLHENVAVLDFNDEYANLIMNHNISYETFSASDSRFYNNNNQMAILPSVIKEIVRRRVYLRNLLKAELDLEYHYYGQIRLETLKQILVCLYGTSGSVWNRYSNVRVFEEINKISRQILLKTKDIVQTAGFDLIYADTDAVFLKKKDATRKDYEEIKNVIARETGLDLTLEFHYKYLVLLYIEADEKSEARKHYYGLTYNNQLITRGIDTRRHDSPAFIKEFQTILLSKLFEYDSLREVLTTGYENALLYITQSIDKIMNGEVQITDLVISKLLRQNIEKYRSLFPHVAAAIRLNISGLITNRGDDIQYVYTDSKHSDPLNRIVPAKLISSENYDKEKYLEMLLDSAEAVLSIFGFNRSLYGFDKKKTYHWWNEIYQQHERDIESAKTEL
jgi:DNA polymerase elongation subunit (family B)